MDRHRHRIKLFEPQAAQFRSKRETMLGIHRCPVCGGLTRGPCICERTAKHWQKLIDIGFAKLWATRPEGLEVPVKLLRPLSTE